jgi:Domain of unknown function (DUF4351)
MKTELSGPNLSFRYETADIRDFDGEQLLESGQTGDNVIAILARLRDQHGAVRRILGRIADLLPPQREAAFAQLVTLAGLRRLEEFVEKEARKMPILNDIMDHKVLGREFKRGRAEGIQEGFQEGERKILRRMIEKRFGAIPAWVEEQLLGGSESEIEALSDRVLDAHSLEDLLK